MIISLELKYKVDNKETEWSKVDVDINDLNSFKEKYTLLYEYFQKLAWASANDMCKKVFGESTPEKWRA
jgi:hypothetical protein